MDRIRVIALAGGVGGAKLASGLAEVLGERLTVLVNTGDDFDHLGLHISPDLDTVVYTLAGVANPATGWGLAGETWTFMDQVTRLGGPAWFRLGDRDLATHAIRTERLQRGDTLTTVTSDLCRAMGVRATVLPMSDDRVRTVVHSDQGTLAFQDYFVRLKCAPAVTSLSFEGAATARFNDQLRNIAAASEPLAVIICPSNPYLSIDPILAMPGLREWIRGLSVPVIAVSPIIGGSAVKGPAAKIMGELGYDPSVVTVARHYSGFTDGFIFDTIDEKYTGEIAGMGMLARTCRTIMHTTDDRLALAHECLNLAEQLLARRG